MTDKTKKLTANQMYDRLSEKVHDWYSPKNGKFVIQYEEGGRCYTFNQPLYEVCYKVKAISYDEYIRFCANDARVCPHETR